MTDGEVKMEEDPPAAEVKKDDAPTAEADSKKRAAADDADDEKPLTAVKKPKVENTKLEDSDDDVPIGKVAAAKPAPAPAKPAKKPVDSDSDDDTPIGKLKQPELPKKAAVPIPKKKEEKKSEKKKAKKEESSSESESSSSEEDSDSDEDSDSSDDDKPIKKSSQKADPTPKTTKTKTVTGGSSSTKKDTIKDWLIERILVRWWYHMEWPPNPRPIVDVPAGYIEMQHYPYMFIHEQSGKVINKRDTDETTPPCHKRYSKYSESELRSIVEAAIKKQIEELKEAEPNNDKLAKILKAEIEEIRTKKKM